MRLFVAALTAVIALLIPVQAQAYTGKEKAISQDQLPAAAQQTIKTHFPGRKVALAKVENELFSKSYTVIFTNGEKIEFDGKGAWTEIKCKRSEVPASLVPAKIAQFVRENYHDCKILEIEKDDGEIEVTLSNYIEVTFNSKYEVIDIE